MFAEFQQFKKQDSSIYTEKYVLCNLPRLQILCETNQWKWDLSWQHFLTSYKSLWTVS